MDGEESIRSPDGFPLGNSTSPLTNLFALLVGVEHYPAFTPPPASFPSSSQDTTTPSHWPYQAVYDPPLKDPLGAVTDVNNVLSYLVDQRHVPIENVLVLRDAEATRANILLAFRTHLIENPRINYGDPILFHYSGHGGRGPAPTGWAMTGEEEDTIIEYIVPYDSVAYPWLPGKPGIPDRTMRALLEVLAKRKGPNITVILDCCHSGHGTRKGVAKQQTYAARGLPDIYVGKISADTDADIWKDEDRKPNSNFHTHVLLAACTRMELAYGNPDKGGVFTSHLLEALREGKSRTYAQLIDRTKELMLGLYKQMDKHYRSVEPPVPPEARLQRQSPQSEFGAQRVLWTTKVEGRRTFAVHAISEDPSLVIIEGAGAILRVRQGTIFELRLEVGCEGGVLGMAVVTHVEAGRCFAQLPPRLTLPRGELWATVKLLGSPVTYAVLNQHLGSPIAMAACERVLALLSASSEYCTLVHETQADLVLCVDEEYVYFDRQDEYLRTLDTPHPKVKIFDIDAVFPGIMRHIAHFNHYLALSGSPGSQDLESEIRVSLHALQDAGEIYEDRDDDYTYKDTYRDVLPDSNVFFVDDQAFIPYSGLESWYAILLNNEGQVPLHAYILLFDPATYGIEVFASPVNPTEPALVPGVEVQFGASAQARYPLGFDLGANGAKDTSFMKVILTSEGGINMEYMTQKPILGYDPDTGVVNYKEAHKTTRNAAAVQPTMGSWGVITRKLTVVP